GLCALYCGLFGDRYQCARAGSCAADRATDRPARGRAPRPAWSAASGAGAPGAPPAQRGGPIGPVPGLRGTVMRLPEGALPPGAPHPDALPVDIFTTKNFYKDEQLWSDPRYF